MVSQRCADGVCLVLAVGAVVLAALMCPAREKLAAAPAKRRARGTVLYRVTFDVQIQGLHEKQARVIADKIRKEYNDWVRQGHAGSRPSIDVSRTGGEREHLVTVFLHFWGMDLTQLKNQHARFEEIGKSGSACKIEVSTLFRWSKEEEKKHGGKKGK